MDTRDRAIDRYFGVVSAFIVFGYLCPAPRGSTRHGIENKDALMPCCGVHYLNLYCCTVCLSVPPIFISIPILTL